MNGASAGFHQTQVSSGTSIVTGDSRSVNSKSITTSASARAPVSRPWVQVMPTENPAGIPSDSAKNAIDTSALAIDGSVSPRVADQGRWGRLA